MQDIVEPLNELGVILIALSPQLPEFGLSITEKHQLAFDILSDPHNDCVGTPITSCHE